MKDLIYNGSPEPQGRAWGNLNPEQNTSLQIFENPEFGKVRTQLVDNVPYFMAFDIAKALGYAEPRQAVQMHCKSGRLLFCPHANGIGGMKATFIVESDVYRLIMRSQLPNADRFQDWVCEDVLPSIRKTGGYIATAPDDTPEQILAKAVLVAQKTIEQKNAQIETLAHDKECLQLQNELQSEELKESAPMVKYYKDTLSSVTTMAINVIANDLGMTAQKLNKILCDKEIQYRQNGTYVLYAKYRDMGLSKHIPITYLDKNGESRTTQHMVWFEAGKKFIIELLKK